MDGNELPDGGFQFGYAAMGAALDLPLGKQCEPAFDLIEPGGMGGGEVQMIPRPLLQPLPDQCGLGGGVVVQHQMEIKVGVHCSVDRFRAWQQEAAHESGRR